MVDCLEMLSRGSVGAGLWVATAKQGTTTLPGTAPRLLHRNMFILEQSRKLFYVSFKSHSYYSCLLREY